jgi:uncharacterized repeat protein (TIGR01451 family)
MRNQPLSPAQVCDPRHERPQRKPLVLVGIVMLTAVSSIREAPTRGPLPPEAKQRAIASYGKLPLHFEANQGQADEQVKFLARGSGYGLFLTSTESVLVLRKPDGARGGEASRPPGVLRLKLLGANPRPAVEGREELPGKSHYFIGNDPKKWRTDVPHYARVNYRDVYPGVSLTYYGNQGQIEYDFVVSPGGDPKQIRLGIEGADDVQLDAEGNLVMSLPEGEVVEKAPVVYQEVDGARKAVDGRFVLRGRREMGFEVGDYDVDRPLVIDPVLVYSTYLGGSDRDGGFGIAVDASRNAYITGWTTSVDFPTANPLQATRGGFGDAFVAKLNAAGSALIYSTYLGGDGWDQGNDIAVDASGNAYVTGYTGSTNFPTSNPLQAANGFYEDAFVTKLNATGSALVYSTYLGGNGGDRGGGIAVDASGNAYVVGSTESISGSNNFPTANPFQAAHGGGFSDAFVTKLNAAGSALVYSTYLGGSGGEEDTTDITVNASGNAYVTGGTQSINFPTANPFQAANGGGYDAFVAKLNAAGSALVYSTYLGGSGDERGPRIAIDASGSAYVTGRTASIDFPTANPLQAANGGGYDGGLDAFVAKLNAAGSALVYSTYLGGNFGDGGSGIAVGASGDAYVTGSTSSTNFPTANPLQAAYGGGPSDAFVAKLNAAGSAFVYSTYLGGNHIDRGSGIAVDASGDAYVLGAETDSTNFPTANPVQAALGGGNCPPYGVCSDAFVARISVSSSADLFVTKTDSQTTAVAGSPVTYTIMVSDAGPEGVTGATVTDTFPAALTGMTWTCTASAGSSCGAASGSGNINQTVNLLVGGRITFVATGTLDISASGTLSNTASVAPPAGITDPSPANNSATDTDTIVAAADPSIAKTDGRSTASPGQAITYTIVASNAGPKPVTGATVADTVPASLTAPTWTCMGTGGGTCTAAGVGDINDSVYLPAGATVTYTLSGTVSANPRSLRNTATIAPSAGIFDPNPSNNSATDDDLLLCFGETVVVPDGRLTASTIGAGATAWFAASLKAGSSYSLEFKNATGSGMPPGVLTVFSGDDGCSGVSTLTTNDTTGTDPAGTPGTARVSFTATDGGFFRARLVNGSGLSIPFSFSWSDTTMYSAVWSTNGSFDTFYSFQNTTGGTVSGTLTLLDTAGVVVSTFNLSIPVDQTASTNTVGLGVARNRTGAARFTHDGPPGALVIEAAIANFSISPPYIQPVKFEAVREAR